MGALRRVGAWISDRMGLQAVWREVGEHHVPPATTSNRAGWLYVLGFVTFAALLLQIVTGIALASRYIPSTGSAYESVRVITEEGGAGRLVRGMHYWGASAVVLFMTLHLARVFLTGSYKFPREVNWLTGVALLALVMLLAFTGQLLRWNQDGLWGLVVASQYAARVPLIGDGLKEFLLAGESVGGGTLSRFFALHAVLLPLLVLGLVGVHLYLVVRNGISELPTPGDPVDPRTYRERYDALLKREGRSYWPHAVWQEAVASAVVIAGIVALAVLLGPRDLGPPPDFTSVPEQPRPDWFLIWYYSLLRMKPVGLETFTMVYLPILAFAALALLPLVAPRGERAPSRRPLAVGAVFVIGVGLLGLTILGYREAWVPDFETRPFSAAELPQASPEVVEGAALFHAKGCQYCHRVLGRGGRWGPDLTAVRARLSAASIAVRIVNGVGEMPPFREALTPEELARIMVFLDAAGELRP